MIIYFVYTAESSIFPNFIWLTCRPTAPGMPGLPCGPCIPWTQRHPMNLEKRELDITCKREHVFYIIRPAHNLRISHHDQNFLVCLCLPKKHRAKKFKERIYTMAQLCPFIIYCVKRRKRLSVFLNARGTSAVTDAFFRQRR